MLKRQYADKFTQDTAFFTYIIVCYCPNIVKKLSVYGWLSLANSNYANRMTLCSRHGHQGIRNTAGVNQKENISTVILWKGNLPSRSFHCSYVEGPLGRWTLIARWRWSTVHGPPLIRYSGWGPMPDLSMLNGRSSSKTGGKCTSLSWFFFTFSPGPAGFTLCCSYWDEPVPKGLSQAEVAYTFGRCGWKDSNWVNRASIQWNFVD